MKVLLQEKERLREGKGAVSREEGEHICLETHTAEAVRQQTAARRSQAALVSPQAKGLIAKGEQAGWSVGFLLCEDCVRQLFLFV